MIIFPSLTKIVVPFFLFPEGQPESIVKDIENMVRTYIEKEWDFFFSKRLHQCVMTNEWKTL